MTGTNSAGSGQASSQASNVVQGSAQAPQNTVAPGISGTATQGQTLTASTGTWTGSPAPSFGYQWQDCDPSGQNCTAISGATLSSYQLGTGDVGSTVKVVVTGTNSAGSGQASSQASNVVQGSAQAPQNTVVPGISGTATQGQTLTASTGTWTGSPAPSFGYQWQDCDPSGQNCTAISGATSQTFALRAADVGSTVKVVVTATNSAGSATAASVATSLVSSAAGPVTGLLDDFNRPNNSGPPSASWSRMPFVASSTTTNLSISSQQAAATATNNSIDYWNPQPFGPDSEAWVTITTKPSGDLDPVVLGLRVQNPASTTESGYWGYFINRTSGTDQYKISVRINGQDVGTLASVTGPELNPGDQLLFRALGSTLELWIKDAGTWTRVLSTTDTRITTNGYLGLYARDTAVRLDNFGGGTLP